MLFFLCCTYCCGSSGCCSLSRGTLFRSANFMVWLTVKVGKWISSKIWLATALLGEGRKQLQTLGVKGDLLAVLPCPVVVHVAEPHFPFDFVERLALI